MSSIGEGVLCLKVCNFLAIAIGQWFPPGTPVSSTSETDHHYFTVHCLDMTLGFTEA